MLARIVSTWIQLKVPAGIVPGLAGPGFFFFLTRPRAHTSIGARGKPVLFRVREVGQFVLMFDELDSRIRSDRFEEGLVDILGGVGVDVIHLVDDVCYEVLGDRVQMLLHRVAWSELDDVASWNDLISL